MASPGIGRIVVVDDDERLTFILRAHLTNAGFEVTGLYDGQKAYEYCVNNKPDVIVLDVQLPGMDGFDLTRALREHPETSRIPIILLTARGNRDDVVLGLDAGAQDYVVKPFDIAELTARVRSMFKLSQVQKELDRLNGQLADEVKRKTSQLEFLYAFVRELNRATDAERIYDLIIEAAEQCTGCRRVSVMVHDRTAGKLVCKRAIGIDPKLAEQVSVDPTAGVAGQVFTTGKTMIARTMQGEGESAGTYVSDTFMSTPLVSTFMMNGERRLGVLNATEKKDGQPFTPDDTECLRSIADSAAIALHNEERRSSLEKATRALLLTVGRLSEYRDEETGLHLERVSAYAQALTCKLVENPKYAKIVTQTFIEDLHQAAPLHDVGKVGIPDDILNKPGKLSDEEYQIMKRHTVIGRHTLQRALDETGPVPLLQMCLDIAYGHHERYDGKGYPRGIAGEEIPLAARIIALVDAYDAMTSQRCYKRAIPHCQAIEHIQADSGAHFDPDIVNAFLEVADEFNEIRQAKADELEVEAPPDYALPRV